ncbi:MAG: redoxin domain-containing protein, partial [Akkermansiaceae bacterium]|nr:redoxin domain-containing protein [Akkermansiaceae bacterium]
HPRKPFALEALTQVVTQEYWLDNYTSHPGWGRESRQCRAIALILQHHSRSAQLGPTCKRVGFGFRRECENFLRAVLENNPHHDVQGLACLALAQFLAGREARLALLKDQPELARRYDLLYGRDYLEELREQDRAKAMGEAQTFHELAIAKYGDVKMPFDETVGKAAKRDLFEIRQLSVGRIAPDIDGRDQDGRQFKLSDYRGKVVLLYFWSEF